MNDAGVGFAHIVVSGKQLVSRRRLGGEGGTANLRVLDGNGNQTLGDVLYGEGNQFGIAGNAALGQKLVHVVAALDVQLIDGAVVMRVVPGADLAEAGNGGQLIVPDGIDCQGGRKNQQRQDGGNDFYGFFHKILLILFSTQCAER